MINLADLHLLYRFLDHVKDQGSHERFDIVEGCVLDFLEENEVDIKFTNNRIEI